MRNLFFAPMAFMPPPHAALRTALVRAMAFAHHKAQEKTAPEALAKAARPAGANQYSGNAVAESDNIVAETAEKIFADLADAQTINRDKKGAWKAPLWQALTEAGLPLSWVGEDCGGSGASLAEGFSVLSAAGRFAVAVPLAETMLAGWLLAQAKIASPDGEMTVVPASPKDRITAQCRRQPLGQGPRRAVCQGGQTFCGARQRCEGQRLDRAGRCRQVPDRGRASASAATIRTP